MLRTTSRADDGQEHELLPGAAGGKFTASHAHDTRAPWTPPPIPAGAVKKNSPRVTPGGYLLLPDQAGRKSRGRPS
ncbi:hypothetical protein ACFXGT_40280 [Streptomyces sp. NPDC059352]|uniref:hypothetical protein n=1 Tax=Streptomyces sp. NPDC059352 TaxID=3346810 RepID=UPI003697A541